MKNSKRILIIIMLLILFILFCLLTAVTIILKKEENSNDIVMNTINTNAVEKSKKEKTIEDVLNEHDSEYINQDNNKIFAKLAKDLYDENGRSNKEFFESLIEDLEPFFPETSFYIIDDEKDITIYVKKSDKDGSFKLIINDIENFYQETDGRDYVAVENSKIVEPSNLLMSNYYLEKLEMHNMYFKYIEDKLTNGRETENGYTVYVDQQIKVKLSPNKSVLNLVFMEDYEDKILHDISLDMKLRDIANLYEDYVFGGIDKGYLGYRSGNYYYFFYEDEASIYSYSYGKSETFENILNEYLSTNNLEDFVDKLKLAFKGYSELEYDPDIQRLFIAYPTRGIKIDIRDNNPKGITLYSNYCFSDTTKKLVKDGKLKYSEEDYVNEYEQMRKEAE